MKPSLNKKPPRWAAWLLFRLSHYEDRYSLADDLEIEYRDLTAEKGSLCVVVVCPACASCCT